MRLSNQIIAPSEPEGWACYDIGRKKWLADRPGRSRSNYLYAIPSQDMVSIPKWINSTDPAVIAGIVQTEIETYPIEVELEPGTVYTHELIRQSGGRSLVHIVLMLREPEASGSGHFQAYFPQVAYLPPPPDSVALWREGGVWVAGHTANNRWAHFTLLGNPKSPQALAGSLMRTSAELMLKEVTTGTDSVVIWTDEDDAIDPAVFRPHFSEVAVAPRPALRKPSVDSYRIIPNSVARATQQKKKRDENIQFAFLILIMILLAAGFLAFDLRKRTKRNAEVQAELMALQPVAAEISGIQARWQALDSISTPARSPLEVLYQLSKVAGERGIRFSSFEMRDESTVIFDMQAGSMQDATAFEAKLENSKELGLYRWVFSSPRSPKGIVTRSCTGELITESTDE